MDYTPRAETVRQLAAAAYLPFVAIFLLSSRRYREVRLIRFHCYQAIGIAVTLLLVLLCASIAASLFGNLPALGLLINVCVGVVILGAMLAGVAITFYGSIQAYQGSYTSVPLITDWVWLRVNGEAPPPRKRRRRRREEDEIDWDELPLPLNPELPGDRLEGGDGR